MICYFFNDVQSIFLFLMFYKKLYNNLSHFTCHTSFKTYTSILIEKLWEKQNIFDFEIEVLILWMRKNKENKNVIKH